MIITKEIKVRWAPSNKKWYLEKGYGPYDNHKEFTVKVGDLSKGSHAKIEITCDYCTTQKTVTYKDFCNAIKNSDEEKYACQQCTRKKFLENNESKHKKGLLTEKDSGYYNFRENRLEALRKYIDEKGSIDGIWNTPLYMLFWNHNDDIMKAMEELGYDEDKLRGNVPKQFWNNENNVKEAIQGFINLYKRFPTKDELIHEVKMSDKAIYRYGGMSALKKLLDYKKEGDLIDNRGDFNRSTYEVIVANFLIAQGIPYKREQRPFPKTEKPYRSDFSLYPEELAEIFQVEVWGYESDASGEYAQFYNNKRKEKEKLYKKYGIKLISIEPSVFKQNYEDIEKSLQEIFAPYLTLRYKKVTQEKIIPGYKLSDEEILETIMKNSEDGIHLPSVQFLIKRHWTFYSEIKKRHGSIQGFADKMGVRTRLQKVRSKKRQPEKEAALQS